MLIRLRPLIVIAAFVTECLAGPLALAANVDAGSASAGASLRERVLLNDAWRFRKDDPPGSTVSLIYDHRPEVQDDNEARPADAEPTEAERLARTSRALLKPWILPTANPFIKDPAHRHTRPEKAWEGNVPYVQLNYDDSDWRKLDLPHDWAIEGPFITTGGGGGMGRLPSAGVGWYRRKFDLAATDVDKRIILEVDGAMSYAAVWINGQLVGGWPFGYASWQLDLTPYVSFERTNQISIRLDNPPASSRWYPGAGIYRNVWLTKVAPVHVGQWGTFVRTPEVSPDEARVELDVALANDSDATVTVDVATDLFVLGDDGRPLGAAVARIENARTRISAGASVTVTGTALVKNPRLWGPPPTQQPHRYVAVTRVLQDGHEVERYETRFGIRSLRFDPDRGVIVNGEHIPIKGVNNHHDLGALGAAFNVRAAERQLEMLREMGCNAVRMAHNPPARELLELTDRMGFLVMNESFDVWERKKTPLDFHLIFPDWGEPDMRSLVRRDRNHPSVIMWSIGNEVGEQYTGEEGAAVAIRLRDIVREEDPTRPVTSAMNYASADMPLPAVLDVISLNYQGQGIRDIPEFEGTERIRKPPQFPAFRAHHPDKVILSSETASAFSSRGVYLFPVTSKTSDIVRDGRGGDSTRRHVTAYELHAVDFGASADKVFASLEKHPYVAGEFVWTGWDHLGEPTPYYGSRSSYAGIIDLAGFKKDRFYLYQAHWRPDHPMAHLLPHWTWPERVGEVTPVHVFTSGDEAELFLNGRSLGRKKKEPFTYRLRWDDVVYEPGTVEVVAYKNGREWARDAVRTAGEPAVLEAEVDRARIAADGRDLAFVTVRIVDAQGTTVPRADNSVRFRIEGPGEIVATDNGDPTSFESFQVPERHAFGGRCLVIVRAKPGHRGPFVLTAESEGLEAATATITAVAIP